MRDRFSVDDDRADHQNEGRASPLPMQAGELQIRVPNLGAGLLGKLRLLGSEPGAGQWNRRCVYDVGTVLRLGYDERASPNDGVDSGARSTKIEAWRCIWSIGREDV